ncbi:MAG: family 43 glycosylhydrolase [Saprospiraceae bacterium]
MKFLLKILLLLITSYHTFAQQLVMPGDYPDPSVTKIGDTFWASATTSNWLPGYPLLKSKDLINWTTEGFAFNTLPAWADFYLWAPEISYENGKTYMYYTAHKKGGNLCIAVASADRPEGPYKDHGTLMCQEVGSIDAFPMRDENGKLYMIWKEDGNSVGKPTPIWAMPMNEERTALTGEKKELFRATEPWENNLVEGVAMIRKGEYYYAFYAASACCRRGCTYGTGIARAKNLLGPWEKYNKNPILSNEGEWKCAGHGTPIEKDGKYYFLYHAYHDTSNVYAGRQGLLIEFTFTPDGWIDLVEQQKTAVNIDDNIKDKFKGNSLSKQWQWSVFQNINYNLKGKNLYLNALPTPTGAFIGQKTYDEDYTAHVIVVSKDANASAGLAAIGDERNTLSILVKGDSIQLLQVKDDKESYLATKNIAAGKKIHLRMQVKNGKDMQFYYSTSGKNYTALNENPVDGSYLPPWDRAVRVGLVAKGTPDQQAVFKKFHLAND